MKIKVDKDSKIYIDEVEKKYSELNTDLLEDIVDKALIDDVEFILDDDKTIPLVKLFYDIENMCKEGAEFRQNITKLNEQEQKCKSDETEEVQEVIENIIMENDISVNDEDITI